MAHSFNFGESTKTPIQDISLQGFLDTGTTGLTEQTAAENPATVDKILANQELNYLGATGSTSAPASSKGGSSGGLRSVPNLDKIPDAQTLQPLVQQASLKMRSMQ